MSQPSALGWKQQLYKIFFDCAYKISTQISKKESYVGLFELLKSQSLSVLCLFPSAETNLTHSVLRQLEEKMQHKLVQMQRKHKDPVKGGSSTTNPPTHTPPFPHTHTPLEKKKKVPTWSWLLRRLPSAPPDYPPGVLLASGDRWRFGCFWGTFGRRGGGGGAGVNERQTPVVPTQLFSQSSSKASRTSRSTGNLRWVLPLFAVARRLAEGWKCLQWGTTSKPFPI